jgi:hypothetical protein
VGRAFEHTNLRASLFERDLVHHQLHDVDAASMIRFEILDRQRIRNGVRIEPLTLV